MLAELLGDTEPTHVDLDSIRDATVLEYLLTEAEAEFLAAARPAIGTSAPKPDANVAPAEPGGSKPASPQGAGVTESGKPSRASNDGIDPLRSAASGVRLSLPDDDASGRRSKLSGIARHIAAVSRTTEGPAPAPPDNPAPTQSAVARAVALDEAKEHAETLATPPLPRSVGSAAKRHVPAESSGDSNTATESGESEMVPVAARAAPLDMRDAGAVVARRRASIRAARAKKNFGAGSWDEDASSVRVRRRRLWLAAGTLWGLALLLRGGTLLLGGRATSVELDGARSQARVQTERNTAAPDDGRHPSLGLDSSPIGDGTQPVGELTQDGEAPSLPGQGSSNDVADGAAVGPVMPARQGARTWQRPGWEKDLKLPTQVMYTIKRGGTARTVANLYKIFHHEMESLNPGVPLDRELPPNTRVVVWKQSADVVSESVGFPGDGSLVGGVPMLEGPGRELKMTPWKSWATIETVAVMDLALRSWKARFPQEQPILVGNMSAPKGGKLEPHSSHQSGRDVDLGYPQKWDGKSELGWQTMDARNLDRDLTWSLLELLVETGAVEVIYVDTSLQKLLYEHAKSKGNVPESELSRWMEYPGGPGSNGRAVMQHVKGHVDHLHVRFSCPAAQRRCQSRDRE